MGKLSFSDSFINYEIQKVLVYYIFHYVSRFQFLSNTFIISFCHYIKDNIIFANIFPTKSAYLTGI